MIHFYYPAWISFLNFVLRNPHPKSLPCRQASPEEKDFPPLLFGEWPGVRRKKKE